MKMKIFTQSGETDCYGVCTKLACEEQGQNSVLIAMTAIVFIAFLAFLANIGQVIHDKMLTQAVVDAAVLSAANVQAVGMNEIADLNAEIEKLITECDKDFKTADNKFELTQGLATYTYYETQINYLHDLQDEANKDFAQMASAAAQKIVDLHNEKYLKLHPKVANTSHKGLNVVEKWTLEEVMEDTHPKEMMGDLQTAHESKYEWDEYSCESEDCDSETVGIFKDKREGVETESIPYSTTIPYKFTLEDIRKLSESTKVYYRARVKRKAVRALVDMDTYGFSVNIPEIIAYSQAQPNKGNIEEMKPDYEARLAPLWQSYPNETSDSDYLSLQKEFKH
jgi:hypothetical protein